MFDSICNIYLMLEVFREKENLLLKDIFISMKDLSEILDDSLYQYVREKVLSFA